ncbi:hypothetical protein [uncultured Pseudomonas sp.]|nr:hypothetical protein [uncultured Pseudomonas sp.]
MTQKAKVMWGSLFMGRHARKREPDEVAGEARIIAPELSKNGHAFMKKS